MLFDRDPFPSTYSAYPGVPTVIRNVTIFDGEGGRIDNGTVVLADGKVVSFRQATGDRAQWGQEIYRVVHGVKGADFVAVETSGLRNG